MNYRRIFTIVNEHTASTVAARYAVALAAACGSHLVLYAAHGDGTAEATLLNTERHLDHLFTLAFERDIPVTRISETGLISHLLPRRLQEEHADLVLYPLTPGESYGAAFPRQTVHRLLRVIRVDLAIMRIMHMGKPHPRHILVPLASRIRDRERLAGFLAALAKSFNAAVTLFHRAEGGRTSIPEDLAVVRDRLHRQHLAARERCGKGPIAKAIVMEAISHHNDLIVLGASGRSPLRRLFSGSPAGDVMAEPPCNAILFRGGEGAS